MGFPHGRVGRNLPDGEAYAYCGVIVEGSGLGEPVRKVSHPVISPLSEHRRGLIMLCNSDFSERLGRMGVRDFGLERGRSPLWISNHPRFHGSAWKVTARKPSQSGRSEPSAELAQPALSSRRAYIPAAVTPNRPCTHRVTQHPPVQDMRLKSKCLFIPRRGDACRMTFS